MPKILKKKKAGIIKLPKRRVIRQKPERDNKTGQIKKGVAQDTNKNGTAGRPPKYKPGYCKALLKYFDKKCYREVTGKAFGQPFIKRFPIDMPLIQDFAIKIGVNNSTLYEWAKVTDEEGNLKYPEFSNALKMANNLQEKILVVNGLHGAYNPAVTILALKNIAKWRDRQDITTDDKEFPGVIILPRKGA